MRPPSSWSRRRLLEPVLDLDRAVVPGAARARLERAVEEAGATGESQHAAVGGGAEEFTPDEPVSENVVARSGYRRGDVAAALAGSDVVVERPVRDQLGPPGLPRAAGRDGRARRRRGPPPHERDAGHVLHALGGGQAVRPVDRVGPGDRRDARRRVRRQADGHRSAGRGGDPRPAPAGPRRADPARGLPDDQPGPGRDPRGRARCHARRPSHRPARPAPVRDRRLRREQHRGDRRDPDRRSVPLGRARDRGLRGRDQPGRHRRLPRARALRRRPSPSSS